MASTTIKEIKTLFTLDSKSLKESMKDADKSVKALKKEFANSQKEVNNFIRELKGVKKELKDLDKDAEIDLNTDEAIQDIDKLIRQMEGVKRATQSLKREAENCLDGLNGDNIDLATFGRLESLLKDMSRIEVVNSDSIDKAQSKVHDLVSSLDSIETDIDLTARIEMATAFGKNDSLKHWVDNNNTGSFSGADDTQQALNRLVSVASEIASKQNDLNIDKVVIGNEDDIKKLSSDMGDVADNVKLMSDGHKQANQQITDGIAKTKEYEAQIQSLAGAIMDFGGVAQESFKYMDFSDLVGEKDLEPELNKIMDSIKKVSESIKADMKNVSSIAGAYSQVSSELKEVETMQLKLNKASDDFVSNISRLEDRLSALDKETLGADKYNEQEKYIKGIIAENQKQLEVIRKTSRELDDQKTLLTQKERQLKEEFDILQKNTKETKTQTEAIEKQGKALKQTKDGFKDIGDSLEGFGDVLGVDIGGFTSKLKGLQSAGSSASKGLKGLGEAAGLSGKSLTALGAASGAAAGALAVFVGAVASIVAGMKGLYEVFKATLPEFKEFESAAGRVTAALGDGIDAIDNYSKALADGFMNQGYVDNMNDFADAFLRVNQMLSGFDGVDTSKLTEDILMVADVTKWDVNEITRAIKNMATNMGIDVSSALDMVYSAWQQTGDPANDLLDTFNEYSSQFNKMGVSADWAFDKIVKGLKGGVYNSDKIADSFKELWLRIADPAEIDTSDLDELGLTIDDIADGSDAVTKAFDTLGISTNQFKEEMAKGGESAENAMDTLITKIANVQDKAVQQNIIAALFGAPGEDMGTEFFEVIADSEEVLEDFNGSVEESAIIIESTLGYQLEQLGNAWQTFKSELFDEAFAPIVKEVCTVFTDNLGAIKDKVMNEVIPAFMQLAVAIIGPFMEGDLSVESFIMGLITGLAEGIKGIAKFIDVCQRIIAVFKIAGNAVEIFWNLVQNGCVVIIAAVNGVCAGIAMAIAGIYDVCVNFGTNFKTIMKNCGIALENVGIAITNAFGSGFASAKKLAADGVNDIIDMMNKIPGMDLKHVSWGGSFTKKDYKSFESLSDNSDMFEKTKEEYWDNRNKTYIDSILKNGEDIKKDWADIQNALDTLNAASIEEQTEGMLDYYKALREKQKEELKAKEEAIKKEKEYNDLLAEANKKKDKDKNKDKISGDDITKEELEAAKKALAEAKKKEEEAKKAAERAKKEKEKAEAEAKRKADQARREKEKAEAEAKRKAAEALKAQQEAIKKRLAWEKEFYDNKRKWQEQLNQQQLALVDDSIEAMKLEIQMVQNLKDSYALTADQMVSYTQKQFDLAVKVRDEYTKRVQDALKKELESTKKKADKEYEIEHRKNNKLIKDKERQIKAIEALMRENEYNDSQDDLDYEIKQTEEEYQKYMFATSYEGIQKREELEERLRELRLEKERAAKKKELEDKKQSLEDEIDDIKDKDDEQKQQAEEQADKMQEIYDNMFEELEKLFEGGTTNIADIQKYAQETNNKTIKNLLNDYVANYKSAMDEVQKYMLSMNQIMGWYGNDLQIGANQGALTGDKDAVDKNDFLGGKIGREEAAQKYNALKQEHAKLANKKDKTAQDKARLKEIEKQVASLRKKYGFSGYQVDGSHATGLDRVPRNNYMAELHKNEAVLTAKEADIWRELKSKGLPNISNSLNKQMTSVDNTRAQAIITNHITNNNGPMLNIENFNNNSGADVRKIAYEINSNLAVRNRSRGKI